MPVLLVIDDEASILEAFRATFDEPSVTLLTAGSAIEGLESARSNRPDVVILDLDLPDLNGLEAFRRLQALDSRLPVIFVTGHGTTDTRSEEHTSELQSRENLVCRL